MAKYKAYPEYKDSGVEWLGEVPLNWQIHSLKRAVEGCTNGVWGGEPDDKHDLIVLRVADFDRQSFKISDLKLTTRSILPKDRGSRLLKQGDLLIEKSGGGDKSLVGCVVLFDKKYEAVTSNFVAKMTPRDSYDGHFLTYAFSQLYAGKVNYPSIKQTTGIQNLDADSYLMEKFCFPPKHEQRNIACFLDHETAKIDNLIEKQQQLIELLKEKRQAVISHAVTKGLNPDVPMKDSGVEWLGEVPEHWEVKKLKHVAHIIDCKNRTPEYFDDGEYLVVRTTNVKKQSLVLDDALYTNERDFKIWTERGVPPVGSILFTREAPAGEICIVPAFTKLCMGQRMMNFICHQSNYTNFLFDYLTSDCLKRYIESEAAGSTVSHLRVEQVYNIPIVIPPNSEQKNIDEMVGVMKAQYSRLIDDAECSLVLLQERRTALISAAVTGKIDVRDWVAPDTQDVEEPQEAIA